MEPGENLEGINAQIDYDSDTLVNKRSAKRTSGHAASVDVF